MIYILCIYKKLHLHQKSDNYLNKEKLFITITNMIIQKTVSTKTFFTRRILDIFEITDIIHTAILISN